MRREAEVRACSGGAWSLAGTVRSGGVGSDGPSDGAEFDESAADGRFGVAIGADRCCADWGTEAGGGYVVGEGAVEDDAEDIRADGIELGDGALGEGAEPASGDGEDDAIGFGGGDAGFKAPQYGASVDDDSIVMFAGLGEDSAEDSR